MAFMPVRLKRHGLNVYLFFSLNYIMSKSKFERQKQTKKARDKRDKDAKINDQILENKVEEIPGLTYVQLEKVFAKNEYQFKRTYLKNALQRLEDGKKILGLLSISKEGKIIKTFVPNDLEQKNRFNQINIPLELITDKNKWKNVSFVYALRNNEFVITSQIDNKLEDHSFHKSSAKLIKSDEAITIILTEPVIEYYQLARDNVSWNIENDLVTVTITPKFKQEKKDRSIKQKKNKKLKILLIEDNQYWADAFDKSFTKANHTVFKTNNFQTAKEIMKNQKIDWMVLDDEIKLIKGAENFFVKYKKINKKFHGTFITSYPLTDLKKKYLRSLGFESIIEKKQDNKEREPEVIAAEQIVRMEVV